MLAVFYHSPEKFKHLALRAKVPLSQLTFNPLSLDAVKAILRVDDHDSHCYVSQESGLPLVHCLTPASLWDAPTNIEFAVRAVRKAWHLHENGLPEETLDIRALTSPWDAIAALDDLAPDALTSIDLEIYNGEISCIAFSQGNSSAFSIPFCRGQTQLHNIEDEALIWDAIARFMASSTPKLFQNFIFDTMWLSYFGVETRGALFDSMILAHLANPELPKGLDDLGRLYHMCARWKNIGSWESSDDLWRYNALDALRTHEIHQNILDSLDPKRLDFYNSQQVPLMRQILLLCERGWTIDKKALEEVRQTLDREIEPLYKTLYDIALPLVANPVKYVWRKGKPKAGATYCRGVGDHATLKFDAQNNLQKVSFYRYEPMVIPPGTKKLATLGTPVFEKVVGDRDFNPNSSDDIKEVLRAKRMNIPTRKKKETVDAKAIQKLLDRHPNDKFLIALQVYKNKHKIWSTYANVKLDHGGKLRFQLVAAGSADDDEGKGGGTVTSRFSGKQTPWETGLNPQNVPKHFRHVIIPHHKDWQIVNLDYKAADPSTVALLARDQKMLQLLLTGDIHAHTASAAVGRDITKEPGYNKDSSRDRQLGKIANNGLNYGMGVEKFRQEVAFKTKGKIQLSEVEAAKIHAAYFATYPGIQRWHNRVRQTLLTTRILHSPFGRQRYFYGDMQDPKAFEEIYKKALAWIPPTNVADALNCLWLRVIGAKGALRFHLLQQCHDSLQFECHKDDVEALKALLVEANASVVFEIEGQKASYRPDIQTGPNGRDLS